MSITIILILLFAHWVGDFVFQNRWMAENKSKWGHANTWVGEGALLSHCLVYGIIIFSFTLNPAYAVRNAFLHFAVDLVTSKCNAVLVKKEDKWGFFTMIGFDQFLHIICLILTWGPANV